MPNDITITAEDIEDKKIEIKFTDIYRPGENDSLQYSGYGLAVVAIVSYGEYAINVIVNGEVDITDNVTGERYHNAFIPNDVLKRYYEKGDEEFTTDFNNWFELDVPSDEEYDIADELPMGITMAIEIIKEKFPEARVTSEIRNLVRRMRSEGGTVQRYIDRQRETEEKETGKQKEEKEQWQRRMMGKQSKLVKTAEDLSDDQIQESLVKHFREEDEDNIVEDFEADGEWGGVHGNTGTFTVGTTKYRYILDDDEAVRIAEEYVFQQLRDEPGMFTQSWLENYLVVSDTDKRCVASDSSSSLVDDMSDDDVLESTDMKDEYDKIQEEIDELDSDDKDYEIRLREFETQQSSLIDKAREQALEEAHDRIYDELDKDPIEYYKNYGYTIPDMIRNNLLTVNETEASEDAVGTDGWQHFLSKYDGNSDETNEGFVVYFVEEEGVSTPEEQLQEREEQTKKEQEEKEKKEQWQRRMMGKQSQLNKTATVLHGKVLNINNQGSMIEIQVRLDDGNIREYWGDWRPMRDALRMLETKIGDDITINFDSEWDWSFTTQPGTSEKEQEEKKENKEQWQRRQMGKISRSGKPGDISIAEQVLSGQSDKMTDNEAVSLIQSYIDRCKNFYNKYPKHKDELIQEEQKYKDLLREYRDTHTRKGEYSVSSPKTPRMQRFHKKLVKDLVKTPKIKKAQQLNEYFVEFIEDFEDEITGEIITAGTQGIIVDQLENENYVVEITTPDGYYFEVSNIPSDKLLSLEGVDQTGDDWEHEDIYQSPQIPQTPQITPEERQELEQRANSEDVNIRIKVAQDPRTPVDILDKLADDVSQYVKYAVFMNPSRSKETRQKLYEDQSLDLRHSYVLHQNYPSMSETQKYDFPEQTIDKEKVENVASKIVEYGLIPSVTGNEQKLLEYLAKDFNNPNYKVQPQKDCLFLEYKEPSKWLVLAHVDRIQVPDFKYQVTEDEIRGQLDNVISVAILHEVMNKNVPVNILFTTGEEHLSSDEQIFRIAQGKDYKIIDLDIDVSLLKDEVDTGAISLRDKDNLSVFDPEIVKYLRELSDKNNIRYVTKDKQWLLDQIGSAMAHYPELKGIYLGVPIFQYHSEMEVVNKKTIDNAIKLLELLTVQGVPVTQGKAQRRQRKAYQGDGSIIVTAEDVDEPFKYQEQIDEMNKKLKELEGLKETIDNDYRCSHRRDAVVNSYQDAYEFNIKMYGGGPNIPDGIEVDEHGMEQIYWRELADNLEMFIEGLKEDYDWIEEGVQVGRSGGWLAIVSGGSIESKIEDLGNEVYSLEGDVITLKDIDNVKKQIKEAENFIRLRYSDLHKIYYKIEDIKKNLGKQLQDWNWWMENYPDIIESKSEEMLEQEKKEREEREKKEQGEKEDKEQWQRRMMGKQSFLNKKAREYQEITFQGIHGYLVPGDRVMQNLVPGKYIYELRHGDDDWEDPVTVEPRVMVNFWGCIVLDEPLDLTGEGYIEITEQVLDDWGFTMFGDVGEDEMGIREESEEEKKKRTEQKEQWQRRQMGKVSMLNKKADIFFYEDLDPTLDFMFEYMYKRYYQSEIKDFDEWYQKAKSLWMSLSPEQKYERMLHYFGSENEMIEGCEGIWEEHPELKVKDFLRNDDKQKEDKEQWQRRMMGKQSKYDEWKNNDKVEFKKEYPYNKDKITKILVGMCGRVDKDNMDGTVNTTVEDYDCTLVYNIPKEYLKNWGQRIWKKGIIEDTKMNDIVITAENLFNEDFTSNTFVMFNQDCKFRMDQLDGLGEIKQNMVGKIKKVNDDSVLVEIGKQIFEVPLMDAYKVLEPFRAKVVPSEEQGVAKEETAPIENTQENIPGEPTEPELPAEQPRQQLRPIDKAIQEGRLNNKMMKKAGDEKTIDIDGNTIKYWYLYEYDGEMNEGDEEHIRQQVGGGVSQGELLTFTEDEKTQRGWWELEQRAEEYEIPDILQFDDEADFEFGADSEEYQLMNKMDNAEWENFILDMNVRGVYVEYIPGRIPGRDCFRVVGNTGGVDEELKDEGLEDEDSQKEKQENKEQWRRRMMGKQAISERDREIMRKPYLIDMDRKYWKRYPYGQSSRDEGMGDTCSDCGVRKGEYHWEDCEGEECPHCGNQLLGCSDILGYAPYIVEEKLEQEQQDNLEKQEQKEQWQRRQMGKVSGVDISQMDMYQKRQLARDTEDIETLQLLMTDKDVSTRMQVADNLNVNSDILTTLTNDQSEYVRRRVTFNPKTTTEMLAILSKDNDPVVRGCIVSHPNIDNETLTNLLNDYDKNVRFEASTFLRNRGVSKTSVDNKWKELNQLTTSDIISKILDKAMSVFSYTKDFKTKQEETDAYFVLKDELENKRDEHNDTPEGKKKYRRQLISIYKNYDSQLWNLAQERIKKETEGDMEKSGTIIVTSDDILEKYSDQADLGELKDLIKDKEHIKTKNINKKNLVNPDNTSSRDNTIEDVNIRSREMSPNMPNQHIMGSSKEVNADLDQLLAEIEKGGEYIVSDIGKKLYNRNVCKEGQIL